MRISGSYADHTQYGIYTMISGLMGLANKVIESGDIGHHSEGAINEAISAGGRRLPRRLREVTGFGDLE